MLIKQLTIALSLIALMPFVLFGQQIVKNGISVNISLEKTTYLVDEEIVFELKVTNTANSTKEIPWAAFHWSVSSLDDEKNPEECLQGSSLTLTPCFEIQPQETIYDTYPLFCATKVDSSTMLKTLTAGRYALTGSYRVTCENASEANLIKQQLYFDVVEPAGTEKQIHERLVPLFRRSERKKEKMLGELYDLWTKYPNSAYQCLIYRKMEMTWGVFNTWAMGLPAFEEIHTEALARFHDQFFSEYLVLHSMGSEIGNLAEVKGTKTLSREEEFHARENGLAKLRSNYPNTKIALYAERHSNHLKRLRLYEVPK